MTPFNTRLVALALGLGAFTLAGGALAQDKMGSDHMASGAMASDHMASGSMAADHMAKPMAKPMKPKKPAKPMAPKKPMAAAPMKNDPMKAGAMAPMK